MDAMTCDLSHAARLSCGLEARLLFASIDIRVGKVGTLEQQRLAERLCQRISETIAKIQLCRMAAASAKVAVGGTGNLRLVGCDRFDRNIGLFDEIIKAS